MIPLARRVTWLVIYAVAMAYVESAVVVYLRAVYYPQGFAFPLTPMPSPMAATEIAREAATLVMLVGVSMLAGANRRERFLAFCVSFGVWDLFYYLWLRVLLGWPTSLLTWDILFLIPVPWIGPVLAPVLVSILLVGGGLLLLYQGARGRIVLFPVRLQALLLAGALLVLASFTVDFRAVMEGTELPPFRWGLFGAGVCLGLAGLALAFRQGDGRRERRIGDRIGMAT